MNRKIIGLVVGGVLIAAAAFAGGYFLSGRSAAANNPRVAFARLSQADREQMASMTAEQRTAFLKEKGIDMPTDGFPGGGTAGAWQGRQDGGGPGGNQILEGNIESVAADKVSLTLTAGGSAKVYVDEATVVGAVSGKEAELVEGASVMVVAIPEAAGVTAAKAILIK